MKKIGLLLSLLLLVAGLALPAGAAGAAPGISPADALRTLQEGHTRYLEGQPRHPRQGRERRALTTAQGQHPLAAVLACSDSRVPVEIIFDQGIGDLFVVRVAGNLAAGSQVGSLEFAVDQLATPLVVVLGHTQCGAVAAVLDEAKLPPNLADSASAMEAAVAKARQDHPEAAREALLHAAIMNNVWQAIDDMLRQSPLIREKVRDDRVKMVGALYDIDSGQVQWLGPHPDQAKLTGTKKGAGKPGKKGKKAKQPEE